MTLQQKFNLEKLVFAFPDELKLFLEPEELEMLLYTEQITADVFDLTSDIKDIKVAKFMGYARSDIPRLLLRIATLRKDIGEQDNL